MQEVKQCIENQSRLYWAYAEETDAYLKSKNAEAITYNDKTILLKQNPGRASVFEELIHATQYRNGENDGSYVSRLNCEIKAQKSFYETTKLISWQKLRSNKQKLLCNSMKVN